MAISNFPDNTEQNPTYLVADTANTFYLKTFAFSPGVWVFNWPSGAAIYFQIFDSTGAVISTVSGDSAAGSAYAALNVSGDKIMFRSDSNNTPIGIKRIKSTVITSGMTLDTITTTSTYTQTGLGYAVLVGGGGGGGAIAENSNSGGGGGGSGQVVKTPLITLTGSMPIVIGAAGNAVPQASGTSGGSTTFAGYTATGGSGGGGGAVSGGLGGNGGSGGGGGSTGSSSRSGGTGSTGSNGSPSSGTTGGNGGSTTNNLGVPIVSGSTGGGGGAGYNASNISVGGIGSGSGIGTGGNGGAYAGGLIQGTSGTGFGSGGGGAFNYFNVIGTSGNGRPGVIYILRGVLN